MLAAASWSLAASHPGSSTLANPSLEPSAPAAAGAWQRVWKGDGSVHALVGRGPQTVIGVGSEGMIISSADGGDTWRYQSPVPEQDLNDLAFVGDRAWAVGNKGLVLYSSDGGATWQSLPSGLTSNLTGVHFIDNNTGWAVGEGGVIIRTTNGGGAWHTQTSGVTTALRAVRMFSDGQHGVAVGDAGTVLTTADGGAAWTPRPGTAPVGVTLRDIAVEGSEAWIVGDAGVIRRSLDNGVTWMPVPIAFSNLREVEFVPGQTQIAWVAGADGRIARTSNGGATWTFVNAINGSSTKGHTLNALGVGDATHAWVGGTVLVADESGWEGDWDPPESLPSWFIWTTKNGASWQHLIGGHYPWFFDVKAATEDIAYLVGMDINAMRTMDGGQTWQELYWELRPAIISGEGNGIWLMAIDCTPGNPKDCQAVGRSGIIAHTTDGGDTWNREYPPGYGGFLYDIVRTSAKRGVITGTHHFFYTTNGASWPESPDTGGQRRWRRCRHDLGKRRRCGPSGAQRQSDGERRRHLGQPRHTARLLLLALGGSRRPGCEQRWPPGQRMAGWLRPRSRRLGAPGALRGERHPLLARWRLHLDGFQADLQPGQASGYRDGR